MITKDKSNLDIYLFRTLLVTVVVAIVSIVALRLIANRIKTETGNIHHKIALTQTVESQTIQTDLLKKQLSPLGDIEAQIESAFPTSDNILDFVSAMENLANQTGVKQNLHFETPTPLGNSNEDLSLSTIAYSAALEGSVNQLTNYLKKFETLPFFAQINSINISADKGWEAPSTINLQAKLYIKNK